MPTRTLRYPDSPWLVCPDCQGALRVTHVAYAGIRRVTKHSCTKCSYKAVSLAEIVVERPRRGQGFDSLRKKLEGMDLHFHPPNP